MTLTTETYGEFTARFVASVTGFIYLSLLLCWHLFELWRENKPEPKAKANQSLSEPKTIDQMSKWHMFGPLAMQIYSIASLTFSIFLCLINILHFGLGANDIHCDALQKFGGLLYHWSKFSLYCLFVARIYSSFANSSYAYPFSYIAILFASNIAIILIFASVCDIAFIHSQTVRIGGALYCMAENPDWGLMIMVVFDLLFSVVCCILFIYPLFSMSRELQKLHSYASQSTSPKAVDSPSSPRSGAAGDAPSSPKAAPEVEKLLYLVRKNSILTCVAIGSTFVTIILYVILGWGWMWRVDQMVNGTCLLLMFGRYNQHYKFICRPLYQCLFCRQL